MAHIPPLRPTVTQQFQETHIGKPSQIVYDHQGQRMDNITLGVWSPETRGQDGQEGNYARNYASGETGRVLEDARNAIPQGRAYLRNDSGELVETPQLLHSLDIEQTLSDIVRFKRSLVNKKSEEALSLLEDPHKKLTDFGKTHEHTSLEDRLLGDGGFQPLAQFMGGEDEAAKFATRILKRRYEQDLSARLGSGRWGDLDEEAKEEGYDPKEFIKEMAQKQAEDVVSAYLGDHEEAGASVN